MPALWRAGGAALVALIVGASGFAAGYGVRSQEAPEAAATEGRTPAPSATDAHDASQFVEDVTLPDGTEVRGGVETVKTWRLQNVGTTDWTDRYLERVEDSEGACETPDRVMVPETRAGDEVDISVTIHTPEEQGHCVVRWKMVDASGEESFPGSRELFFEIEVGGP